MKAVVQQLRMLENSMVHQISINNHLMILYSTSVYEVIGVKFCVQVKLYYK